VKVVCVSGQYRDQTGILRFCWNDIKSWPFLGAEEKISIAPREKWAPTCTPLRYETAETFYLALQRRIDCAWPLRSERDLARP
jgi:hypothetical protein